MRLMQCNFIFMKGCSSNIGLSFLFPTNFLHQFDDLNFHWRSLAESGDRYLSTTCIQKNEVYRSKSSKLGVCGSIQIHITAIRNSQDWPTWTTTNSIWSRLREITSIGRKEALSVIISRVLNNPCLKSTKYWNIAKQSFWDVKLA